ncbi:MAG: acyl-CoA dehydrogenase family protein, partial [Acidobacteriota bacterium]
MNFDWSTELAAARDAVRAVVTKRIDPAAGAIDRDGAIPPDLRAALADAGLDDVWAGGPLAGVCLLEEVATASAAVAVSCGVARAAVGSASLPGLRGAAVPEGQP